MNWKETVEFINRGDTNPPIVLTPSQEWACCYLELQGLRFCVDFGYQNCERLAQERLDLAFWNKSNWIH